MNREILIERVREVLGQDSEMWLFQPQRFINGQKPWDYANTPETLEYILTILGRCEHGIYF